jgi:predicted CoA-binding protein
MHVGLYLRPPVVQEHRRQLVGHGTTKSAVHLPLDREVPVALVKRLVRARMKINDAEARRRQGSQEDAPADEARSPFDRTSDIRRGTRRVPVPKFTVQPSDVMRKYRIIAVVGASKNPEKEAYSVPAYLRAHGYTIVPVNPTTDSIDGLKAYPSLSEIPMELAREVEVVEVFRPSEEFPQVARQVAEMKKKTGRPFVFWGQLHLENEEAKQILAGAKVDYVMDKCMRVEHQIMGELP